jgi:lysophospholipase L1-like esterase
VKHKSRFFQLFGTDNIAYVCLLLCGILVITFYSVKKDVPAPAAKPVASTPTTIGYVGDSITYGTGGFRTAVDTEVGALGSNYKAINHGVGGTTSKDWQPGSRIYNTAINDFKERHVRVVSIMLGTNDARDDIATSSTAYKKHMTTLMNSLLASGVQQVIVNYPPYAVPGSGGLWSDRSPGRLEAYMAQLDNLVDGKRVLKGDTKSYRYFEDHQNELVDGIHPNGEGYDQLGKLWAKAYIAATAKPSVGVASVLTTARRSS